MIQNRNHYTLFGFKLKNELQEIYLVEFFRYLGISLVTLFLPIYLYESTGFGIRAIFIFYLLLRICSLVLTPLMGEIICRKGLRFVMVIGAFSHILLFMSISLIDRFPFFFWIMIFMELLKNSFWFMGQNTDIAIQASKGKAASKMVVFKMIYILISIVVPVLSAYIITNLGYNYLYSIAVFFAILTFVLSFLLGETKYQKYDFPSKEVYKRTLKNSVANPRTIMNIIDGFRGVIVLGVWPLLLYLVLGDIKSIGWLSSIVLLVITIVAIRISRNIDKNPHKLKRFLTKGMLFEGLSWVGKIGSFNIFLFFATDTITKISSEYVTISLQKMNFGRSRKSVKALEDMAEREISISIGQIIAAGLLLMFSFVLSDLGTLRLGIFVLAIMSLLASYIPAINSKSRI